MPLKNYGLYDDYIILKLVIVLLLISLIIVVGTLFYKLYKDSLLIDRKKDMNVQIDSLLNRFWVENEERASQDALNDIKLLFVNNKCFRDSLICELKKRLDEDETIYEYIDLYHLLGSSEITRNKLMSEEPILIYQGLQETDKFNLFSEKDNLIRLQEHSDIRISVLASCILFKYKDEINVADILNLQSILCPMVEIKVFNEFRRHSFSPSGKDSIIRVHKESLELDISDKLRFFLNRSLKMIDS